MSARSTSSRRSFTSCVLDSAGPAWLLVRSLKETARQQSRIDEILGAHQGIRQRPPKGAITNFISRDHAATLARPPPLRGLRHGPADAFSFGCGTRIAAISTSP